MPCVGKYQTQAEAQAVGEKNKCNSERELNAQSAHRWSHPLRVYRNYIQMQIRYRTALPSPRIEHANILRIPFEQHFSHTSLRHLSYTLTSSQLTWQFRVRFQLRREKKRRITNAKWCKAQTYNKPGNIRLVFCRYGPRERERVRESGRERERVRESGRETEIEREKRVSEREGERTGEEKKLKFHCHY